MFSIFCFFFFQAEDGIRDHCVTGVQTCALPISLVGCMVGRALSGKLNLNLMVIVSTANKVIKKIVGQLL